MTVDWIRAALDETGKTRSGLARALGREQYANRAVDQRQEPSMTIWSA